METKKVKVNKSDEPTLIAEKLIDAEAREVIFSIPKFSRFGESLSNFKLIAREAEVLEKKVIIESVDDDVLAFAKEAGLESINPFMEERKKRFSDIVGPGGKKAAAKTKKKSKKDEEEDSEDPEDQDYEIDMEEDDDIEEVYEEEEEYEDEDEEEAPPRKRKIWGEPRKEDRRHARPPRRGKGAAVVTTIAVVLAAVAYVGLGVLPKATITLTTRKEPWTYTGKITVDKNKTAVSAETDTVPGQVFIKEDVLDMTFPATGERFIERKATGKITIYNAYSSQNQQLVVNTRFETPTGKIFRLTEGITVPGAQIKDGEISPSSIVADVIADQAGDTYNLSPVAKLTIPGFSGTPRFSGFYGELKEGTSRGFIGQAKVPTETDLNKAKAQSLATLESNLRSQLLAQLPEGFKLLDDAAKFTLSKQVIDANTDTSGKFKIHIEGSFAALTFKEQSIFDLIVKKERAEKGEDYVVSSQDVIYPDFSVANPAGGIMELPVQYQAQLARAVDTDSLKVTMRGQSESELRTTILSIPGVENAKIALWPFWVRTVPKNTEKVTILVE